MSLETQRLAKQKMSQKAKIQCAGAGNPMYGKTHTPSAIQKIFAKRPMNNLEKYVADYFDFNNIEYYHNFFINGDSTHSYDFKIKGIKLLIEIDGDYWHGGPKYVKYFHNVDSVKSNDVLKTEIAENSGFKLIRFWESDIENNSERVFNEILTTIREMRICK